MPAEHFAKDKGMPRFLLLTIVCVGCVGEADAQRVASLAVAAGPRFSEATHATAAFTASAGLRLGIPWLLALQRSVAELDSATTSGIERDVSLALLPVWEPFGGRLFFGVGAALTSERTEVIGVRDVSRSRVRGVAMAGVRIPLAGEGVAFELSARADDHEDPVLTGLLGVRVRFGIPHNLKLGEPVTPAATARAAVWNDVLMQLILLQQSLESFSRIKQIDTGIELEFENGSITLWDDIAKAARVLAAADPPVIITAFGPNAGRVAAAVTAGSFPAERVKLLRDNRVFLRVEH
jgi:hypothetical protein